MTAEEECCMLIVQYFTNRENDENDTYWRDVVMRRCPGGRNRDRFC